MIKVDIPCEEHLGNNQTLCCQGNLESNLDIDKSIMNSLTSLLKLYKMHVTESPEQLLVSGGMQQYLIRQSRLKSMVTSDQPRRGLGSATFTFHDLPDSLQLHIFSFLSAKDLCRLVTVCHHWHNLSHDDILWQRKLQQDIKNWDVIGHMTNPAMYKECESDWSYKAIYLRCSPEVNQAVREQNNGFHHLSSMLRALWPRKVPKTAMFGPGLESSTSGLVRKIMFEESDMFKKIGVFPGTDGVGSGFTLKLLSGASFHLTTLYTTTREERQRLNPEQRLQHNRMLARDLDVEQGGDVEEEVFHLNSSIKDFCRTVDAFIFVVDSSQDNQYLHISKKELFAMVNERWSSPKVPVLVLCCVTNGNTPRIPCIEVVNQLQLSNLSRPWQAHNCVVEGLNGLTQGLHWLLEQAQRK